MTVEEKGRATAQERSLFKTDRFLNDLAETVLKSLVNSKHISKHIVQQQHVKITHLLLKSHLLHSFPFGEDEAGTGRTGEDEPTLETGKSSHRRLERMKTRIWRLVKRDEAVTKRFYMRGH